MGWSIFSPRKCHRQSGHGPVDIKTPSSGSRPSVTISAKNFEEYVEAEGDGYSLVLSEACDSVEESFEFVELSCGEEDEDDDEEEELDIISSPLEIDSLASSVCTASTLIEDSSVELVIGSTPPSSPRLSASSSVSSLRSSVVQEELCRALVPVWSYSYPPEEVIHESRDLGCVTYPDLSEAFDQCRMATAFSTAQDRAIQDQADLTPASESGPSAMPVLPRAKSVPTWAFSMPYPGSPGTPYFDGYNVTEFLERFSDLCSDYALEEGEKIRRLPRYCDVLNEQYVKSVIDTNLNGWKSLVKTLRRDYKDRDLNQQIHSIGYLESFKDKIRTSVEEIPQYCRQYSAISKPLFDAGKIQSSLRSAWFLQGLPEAFSNEFSIRHDLDDDDETKMDFDTLMHQVLQLCRSKVTMKKARKVGFKTPKTTALVDEMQPSLSHGRDEDASDLMRKMKARAGATAKQISPDMEEITDAMKKMTINVDNLVNCVSMTAGAKGVPPKITSAPSAPVVPVVGSAAAVGAAAGARSYVAPSFGPLPFASTDRPPLDKCLYCFSKDHLYKRDCKAFNDDLVSNRVHLQDKRVHLGPYSPGAQHVRMMKGKSQRQCVEEAERLSYSIPSQAQVDVHTVRLGEGTDEEISTEDEAEVVLVDHAPTTSVNAILAAARSEPKPDPKANKHHEPIRRILKRKVEKEEKLPTAKTVRQGNWKGAQEEDASTDEDTKDAEMAEASEPVKVVREVKEALVEKKTRFTPEVKSKGKEEVVEDKVEEIMPVRKVRGPARPKMVDLWKKDGDEKEFLEKIKKAEVTFSLSEIIAFAPLAQKIFSKPLSDHEVLKFKVNALKARTRSEPDLKGERWYSCGSPKVKVILNDMVKTMALLDSGAEINVMTRRLMNMVGIAMRPGPRLKLISHTGHDMDFDGVCDDVEVNIGGLRTLHHIFVVPHADHQLVLGQPFLMDVSINYDYRNDGVYAIISNPELTQSAIFKALDRNDHANRGEEEVFPETSSLN
jgi:hypothetical protein